MRRKWIFLAPLGILAFIALGGLVVQLLWNTLLPPIFALREITFWQAVGLLALCRILFGGIGHRGFGGSYHRRRLMQRWQHMTPEERERFREGMRTRCGVGPSAGENKGQ